MLNLFPLLVILRLDRRILFLSVTLALDPSIFPLFVTLGLDPRVQPAERKSAATRFF